ncbi:MAG TPA: TlpA disulfide reductase family protein [Pyrinomonadaceae bacterium]|jgi:thiol-disulfide isomerase/thioredoxin
MKRLPLVVAGALAVSFALACGTTDYTASQSSNKTATPQGQKLPRTALPMPPVATAHESTTNAPNGVALVNASTWTTLDGRRARGSDFQGKVLILDFWATYCPPCRDEVPHLIDLQRRYGAQGLHVVGLNVGGDEDRPKVPAFIEEFGIQYALGYPDAPMSELFFADNSAIPQTYVYDRQGRLLKKFVGFDRDTMPAELERAVQAALAEKPPTSDN